MADNVQKAEEKALSAEDRANKDRETAQKAERTPEQERADKSAQKADDARAEAEEAKRQEGETVEATTVGEKRQTVVVGDESSLASDHLSQRFSNDPANPKLADGVEPVDATKQEGVKLLLTTSDTIARGQDDVAYVPEKMVGDYLRAGWRKAEA